LIDGGRKNIAMVALALDKPEKEDRIIGYKRAVADYGLEPYVYPLSFKVEYQDYVGEITSILRENRKLDAVVFGTNYLGISGLEAITRLDLKIPKDLAIVSFDDHDLFRIHKPSITVVAQPIEEIAQTVIETLLAKLQHSETPKKTQTIYLPTSLIVRDSS
jgi:LacI family transcriptional regulator